MSNAKPDAPSAGDIPGAEDVPDVTVKERSGPSIVWIVPIVAALIGGAAIDASGSPLPPRAVRSCCTSDSANAARSS